MELLDEFFEIRYYENMNVLLIGILLMLDMDWLIGSCSIVRDKRYVVEVDV